MKVTSQAGFVLHSRPYKDSSAVTELFSDEYGRIGLVIRGARRKNSRTRLAVTPLQELLLAWVGRGELYTLTDVEQKTLLPRITGKRLASAFYINELLMRLLHRNDPHRGLYTVYRTTLLLLSDGSQDLNHILRLFEKRLLDELGYGLVLESTVDTNE
ncbi:MAG TPA: DNA repair protein RecO, partial [Gammaproteobacteria bacterium]|nr:DNA repair protein RecO [Gammaproteobacteria bacterium]